MNDQQRHRIEYLLSQIDDDSIGLDMTLQHVTGQEILKQPSNLLRNPLRLDPVSHANTPRVIRTMAIGTLMVSIAAFITATIVPLFIYVIPTYIGCVALMMGYRQHKLSAIA